MVTLHESFYEGSVNLERISWASKALTPKKEDPVSLSDLKPISLINPSLKILSKFTASRLRKVINLLVDISQSAFIKGRCILDDIVTTEELIFRF